MDGTSGDAAPPDAAPISATYLDFTDSSNWSTVDLGKSPSFGGGSFDHAGFDGRNVYFAGRGGGSSTTGVVIRYDSQLAFESLTSWSAFDVKSLNQGAVYFRGFAFDGRYVYAIPSSNLTGLLARYDTTADFGSSSAWKIFDTKTVNALALAFRGASFDGRYLYLAPNHLGISDPTGGKVLRYDTQADIDTPASWAWFDPTQVHPESGGFTGSTFDGRYVYLVPTISPSTKVPTGRVVRYDTQGTFTSTAAWSVFDASLVDPGAKQFCSGVFDGHYVYFIPAAWPPVITRYDTTLPFQSAASWSTFTADTYGDGGTQPSYTGGIFDGRYLHLVPNGSVTLRFDTKAPFTDPSSWKSFDTVALGPSASNFLGGGFDGEYVYFAPGYSGVVVRFHAKTPRSLPAGWNASFY